MRMVRGDGLDRLLEATVPATRHARHGAECTGGGAAAVTRLGRMIAAGRTSVVYEFGRGSVVKVARLGVPEDWAAIEASITDSVHERGLPTPAVRGLTVVRGRESVVFEHIHGPSMWEQIDGRLDEAASMAVQLAELQLMIHRAKAPASLPDLVARIRDKIGAASRLSTDERGEARQLASSLPTGSALCHGDLHPGNVLMSDRGPVVIDWFDAAVGSPIADVVRSSLLMRPPTNGGGVPHLPGANPDVLERLHRDYVRHVLAGVDIAPTLVRSWEAVLAAGRLAERAERDDSELVALWRGRDDQQLSPLVRVISTLGIADHERADRRHQIR